jgi:pimeloyl-ACP methyl ester carboxylesterase
VPRPRILLVPTLTEIEWRIRPLLEDWAEVASFDAPGVGDEAPAERANVAAIEARGVAELERRGWDRYLVAGDEYGGYNAVRVASSRPEGLAGIALGHACLSMRQQGERAPVNEQVMSTFARMASVDYRTYVRHLTQITQNAYDDATAEEYERRVPQELTVAYSPEVFSDEAREDLAPRLRELEVPMLFAKHEGCLGWTDEGFDDATAAFPQAEALICDEKPSVSPAFAEALREFCRGLDWGEAG